MSLYRELPAGAQTAYAELYELAQIAETRRSPASLVGKIAYKTIKTRRYAYWAFKEIDGRKREYYLGPESPAIQAIEAARSEGAPAAEVVARQAAAAGAQGCSLTPPKHFRIAKRLADYQFFRAGGLLVGTHAFLALGNQLGVAWGSGTRTLDLDFGHAGPGGNVAVALPADLRVDADDALRSLALGFLPAPDLGVALSPLKFFEYLLEAPGQSVLIDRNDACLVNLPDPARYGLHKLIVAAERGARHPKYRKDILQALALVEWHLDRAPHALAEAWRDLAGRGAGWRKRAIESLGQAPVAQTKLVLQFKEFVGLK